MNDKEIGDISSFIKRYWVHFVYVNIIVLVVCFIHRFKKATSSYGCIVYHGKILREALLKGEVSLLNDYVKEVRIVKSCINPGVMPILNLNYFSHWSLLVKSERDQMYILSPSSKCNIDVYAIKPKHLHNGGKYVYIKGHGIRKYVICDPPYIPDYKVTVNDFIRQMHEANRKTKYMLFSHNCHYITKYTLSYFASKMEFPTTDEIKTFMEGVNDILFGENIWN